jgi:hypothetical protein
MLRPDPGRAHRTSAHRPGGHRRTPRLPDARCVASAGGRRGRSSPWSVRNWVGTADGALQSTVGTDDGEASHLTPPSLAHIAQSGSGGGACGGLPSSSAVQSVPSLARGQRPPRATEGLLRHGCMVCMRSRLKPRRASLPGSDPWPVRASTSMADRRTATSGASVTTSADTFVPPVEEMQDYPNLIYFTRSTGAATSPPGSSRSCSPTNSATRSGR